MSLFEEAIRKAKGRVKAPLEFWVCTNPQRYRADRFRIKRNFPNKMHPDLVERAKQSIKYYSQINPSLGGKRGS